MSGALEPRLAELPLFVNREDELADFQRMLENNDPRIIVLSGGGGVGKSSLIARMWHECALHKIRKTEVVSTETRHRHYLEIMRKLRDDIGVESFSAFTDLVNFYTVPQYNLQINVAGLAGSRVSVGEGLFVTGGSSTGDIAGILVKDIYLTSPRTDQNVPEGERMCRLTDVFHRCMKIATEHERLVVFLDATEKMTPETTQWVWNELLQPVLQNDLPNVLFVLSGRSEPELNRDWRFFVKVDAIKPLAIEHVIKYLGRRGLPEQHHEILADAIMEATDGLPYKIANFVDGILKRQRLRP